MVTCVCLCVSVTLRVFCVMQTQVVCIRIRAFSPYLERNEVKQADLWAQMDFAHHKFERFWLTTLQITLKSTQMCMNMKRFVVNHNLLCTQYRHIKKWLVAK